MGTLKWPTEGRARDLGLPMRGVKHSLNVATAGGVVLYELLRKYRGLCDPADRPPDQL